MLSHEYICVSETGIVPAKEIRKRNYLFVCINYSKKIHQPFCYIYVYFSTSIEIFLICMNSVLVSFYGLGIISHSFSYMLSDEI